MAENNTGGKGPISSGMQPGPGEHAAGASGSGSGMGSTGSESRADRGFSAEAIKETGARMAQEARQYAGGFASQAVEKSRSMFDQQKDNAVGQVSQVCNAIRTAANQLHGEGQDQVAHYVELVADQLDSLGTRIREKDLDTIIRDTQNLARRAPTTFFVGSMVAGFLLARFVKSSSRHHASSQGNSAQRGTSGMEVRRSSMGGSDGAATTFAGGVAGPAGMTADTAPNVALAPQRNGGDL